MSTRLALLVIAVAVADHAFLRPAPGTTPGDHLASGLVPVAVAVALAWWAPGAPLRARGIALLVCGLLAVVAAAVTRDLTGIAGGVAGALLVVAGAGDVWRGRRRDGRLTLRVARRAGAGVAVLAAAYLVVLPLGLAIVATHKPRTSPAAAFGRPVVLRTSDGLRLHAGYVASRNGAAVLVFPGRSKTLPAARLLVSHGYGVLLLDPRGQGASEGDVNRRGWGGVPDVTAAVDFLVSRRGVHAVGGIGLSVGGELLLEAAAGDPRLQAVVSEGAGIRSIAEQMHFPDVAPALRWLSPMLIETAAGAVLSDHLPPPDLADLTPRIGRGRVLLIRARDGNGDEVLNTVYGRAAQLWAAPGGHTGALAAAPAAYERRVIGFLDRRLLPFTTGRL